MILVSDTTLVLKSSGSQALVFFTNAMSGAPIANASIALWESYYVNSTTRWRRLRQTTDADGLARFGYRDSPLEQMAYTADEIFQKPREQFNVESFVRAKFSESLPGLPMNA